MNLNAVGIDVSKRKSTVSVLRPGGDVLMKPFDISHRTADFQTLADKLKALDGETRVVMECTGHYYEPVARELSQAGLFVSAVNPQIINKFQGQGNPLRKVKTDKADSVKIARYTLDSWANLKQYTLMDELHTQLKTMNRQFDFYTKHKTAMNNNLIALIDQTYPGANTYFDSPAREDGSQKWVDFLDTYWHVDCVRKMSLQAFTDHYQNGASAKVQLPQIKSGRNLRNSKGTGSRASKGQFYQMYHQTGRRTGKRCFTDCRTVAFPYERNSLQTA